MHVLAGLDRVDSGSITMGGQDITGLNDKELTQLRRDRVGFIFQAFNLVPTLSAEQNIELPVSLARQRIDPEWKAEVVDRLELGTDSSTARTNSPEASSSVWPLPVRC